MQIIEAPLQAQKLVDNIPTALYDHCKALDKPISGNAAGLPSSTDLRGLPLGPFPQRLGWLPKGIGAMAG